MGQYAALARMLAVLIAAAGLFCSGWWIRGVKDERDTLKDKAGEQQALNELLASERTRANQYSDQVIALLSAPKAGTTIREIVRNAPSNCVRPEPVSTGLQRAVESGNQAIAASRGGPTLQGNAAGTQDR